VALYHLYTVITEKLLLLELIMNAFLHNPEHFVRLVLDAVHNRCADKAGSCDQYKMLVVDNRQET
jgi:hypothetical protein